jgi:ABC-2 type transport system ATP-binding protein
VTPSLRLEGVCVDRGGIRVASGISYDHAGPGWIGIVGANGSGKTTLLRAIAGRLPLAGGRIAVDGCDLSHDRGARAQAIGFSPDANMLPEDLSPAELFALASIRPSIADAGAALEPLRSALGIDRFLHRKVGMLSAGTRQRVAIYSAFVDQPTIAILDEPFNWLDPLTAFDCKRALLGLVEQGLLLLTALHDVSTLVGYCSRGLLLADGKLALRMEQAELASGSSDPMAFERRIVDHLRPGAASAEPSATARSSDERGPGQNARK